MQDITAGESKAAPGAEGSRLSEAEGTRIYLRKLTSVVSWHVVKRLCDTWDGALTSKTHGTYLFRKRKGGRSVRACPLLRLEIVRIDDGQRGGHMVRPARTKGKEA